MDTCGYNTFIEHALDMPATAFIAGSFRGKVTEEAGNILVSLSPGSSCDFYAHFGYFGNNLDSLAV